jgi:hypothetical protein
MGNSREPLHFPQRGRSINLCAGTRLSAPHDLHLMYADLSAIITLISSDQLFPL